MTKNTENLILRMQAASAARDRIHIKGTLNAKMYDLRVLWFMKLYNEELSKRGLDELSLEYNVLVQAYKAKYNVNHAEGLF